MTDTPIADAFRDWRRRIRENPDRDVFYEESSDEYISIPSEAISVQGRLFE